MGYGGMHFSDSNTVDGRTQDQSYLAGPQAREIKTPSPGEQTAQTCAQTPVCISYMDDTRGCREDKGTSYPFFIGDDGVGIFSISAKRLIASRMI